VYYIFYGQRDFDQVVRVVDVTVGRNKSQPVSFDFGIDLVEECIVEDVLATGFVEGSPLNAPAFKKATDCRRTDMHVLSNDHAGFASLIPPTDEGDLIWT
jgi:hypothetical protein